MSTSTCPNCGKPVRPGARFCGHCGQSVPATPPAQPPAAAPQPPPQPLPQAQPSAGAACPHCGQPVRPGARFCKSCGQAIAPEPAQPPAVAPVTPPAAAPAPGVQPTPQAGVPTPPPGAPPAAAPPPRVAAPPAAAKVPPAAKPKKRRRVLVPALVIILLVGCAVVLAGGFAYVKYLKDPLGLLPQRTVTSVATTSVTPAVTAATTAPTQVTPPTVAPTNTLLPTATVALTPTIAAPTATITPTLSPMQTREILFDEFNGELRDNWKIWSTSGGPLPAIDKGPGDQWLYLKAVDDPGEAGATTKIEIANEPGVEIIFQAQVDPPFTVLIFDWDPSHVIRGPEVFEDGVIHIEIRRNRLFLATLQGEPCDEIITGTEFHRYRLKITEGPGIALYLDDQGEPICRIESLGLAPMPGRFTFTGAGWVTMVRVTEPVP